MFRIAALNESGSSEGSQGSRYVKESTKEAKEAEAFALYHKALGLLRNGDILQAETVFRDLLLHDFLKEALVLLGEKGNQAIHPGLQLIYSIQKNLAAMATQKKDYDSAMKSYLEAVKIDSSEVTVWYKMGIVATKLEDFHLAKLAFEHGLECNPKHWPCLDHIITLMYALNNYMECLYFISRAFELQVHYEKGYALRDKIFKEQPCLKGDTEEFFELCDPEVFSFQLDEAIAKEYVEEALQIRRRRQELSKPPEPERLDFPPTMKEFSWRHVGQLLIELFDKAINAEPRISVCLKVNVPDYSHLPADDAAGKEDTVQKNKENEAIDEQDVEMTEAQKPSDDVSNPPQEGADVIDEPTVCSNNKLDTEENMEVEISQQMKEMTNTVGEENTVVTTQEKAIEEFTKVTIKVSEESETDTAPEKEEEVEKMNENLLKPCADEESDSVLEAINVAHSLLDSLSPVKSSSQQSNSPPEGKSSSGKDVKIEIPKMSEIDPISSTESVNQPHQIAKSSSLGFSIANIISVKEQTPTDSQHQTADLANTNMAAVGMNMYTSTPVTVAPSVNSTAKVTPLHAEVLPTKPLLAANIPVISSDGTIISSSLAPSPSMANAPIRSLFPNPSSVVSSTYAGSQLAVSSSIAGTVLPSSSLCHHQDTSQSITMASVATSRSDHGYSKSYDLLPSRVAKNSDSFLSKDVQPLKSQCSEGFIPSQLNLGSGDGNSQSSIPGVQSLPMSAVAMEMGDKGQGLARKVHKRRRISAVTEEIMMYGKRRSARVSVRNTGRKKEEETVNFYEFLQTFLPSSLKTMSEDEDGQMDSTKEESSIMDTTTTSESPSEDQSETIETGIEIWDEVKEVRSFLEKCQQNQGLAHMMRIYLLTLGQHCKVKWDEAVKEIYLGLFSRIRKAMFVPDVFNCCDSDKAFQVMSQIFLPMLELQLDKWLAQGHRNITSPSSPSSQMLQDKDIPAHFDEDLLSLAILCSHSDRLGSLWIDHSIRVYWLRARYCMLRGRMEEAVTCFERTCEYLEYAKEEEGIKQVCLPNCTVDNVINLRLAQAQQDLLQKSCSGEETQRLYEQGQYEKVVELLLQSFLQPAVKSKMAKMMSDPSERRSQLTLLQEALYKTGDLKRCIVWGEESLHEAYHSFLSSRSSQEQTEWIKTMVVIFNAMIRIVSPQLSIAQSLPQKKVIRLSQNLMRLIDSNMSLPEHVSEMTVDTVLPWILLYHILKDEEDKLESSRLKDSNGSDDTDEEALSSSHMLLNIAHDYLGSRCWCTKSDGALLQFFMTVLRTRMETESRFQEEYQQAFEQCVYCLYGHPNKKGKAKHLQDHNAPAVTLQWEQAIQVFDYFRPKTLPEFDGYKSETISSEIEFLLKRIIPLIPEKYKTIGLTVEEIQNYVEGSSNVPPALPEQSKQELPVVGEIYYLLGDYYLKNKETMKAIKFYLLDVCVNPTRLDSWAGMALVRMSQIDAKLASADLKMDAPIYKKSVMALRCFKRAVEIDDSNVKLWIEYGTLAYQLHSHASRQIRWKKWFAMDDDMVQIAKESKKEMLQTALNCFKRAGQCQREWSEDEWLHTYMLAKCFEKLRKPIQETACLYFKTLGFLHEDGAKYPKKIVYSYITPHLAVESLEMYYRIHVLVIKALLQHKAGSEELDYRYMARLVLQAAQTPFVKRGEKGYGSRVDVCKRIMSESSADENSCSTPTHPGKRKSGEKSQVDHTYFRQKSNYSNQGEDTPSGDLLTPGKCVTTLELHAEGDAVLTKTTTHCTNLPAQESSQPREATIADHNLLTDGVENVKDASLSAKAGSDPSLRFRDHDSEIKELLKRMTDIVESKFSQRVDEKKSDGLENNEAVPMETDMSVSQPETDPVAMEINQTAEQLKETLDSIDSQSPEERIKEDIDALMLKPVDDVHKELIDRCRQAFELCLRRFPTHYKSHYRLAHLYMNSPYHKDLTKAHHILLGSPHWQQLDYMPSQGLFGERKQTKFFQGIWKIPIDEIDRSGSFPSHLNRCIELTLQLLKEEKDSPTLHQVHLHLNRQPEPGKKFLRDAEKKYYALTSHRYTLDAIESQIEDMKKAPDADARMRFLMNVYKVREHGVNKLNKHPERTNKLLAEAYRVVLRKLETLPHQMLLDQAVRYCSHQQSQTSVKKTGDVLHQGASGAMSASDSSMPASNLLPTAIITPIKHPSTGQPMNTSHTSDTALLNGTLNTKPSDPTTDLGTNMISEMVSEIPTTEGTKAGIDAASGGNGQDTTNAPTVKIKMGLLQAVKKLKPSAAETSADEPTDRSLFSDFSMASAASEDESERPILSGSEGEEEDEEEDGSSSSSNSSSTSSGSSDSESSGSSSSSSSESDDDEEGDVENEDKKGIKNKRSNEEDSDEDDDDGDDVNDNEEQESGESDDETSDKDNTTADESALESGQVTAATTDDDGDDEAENDSSDEENEIDLDSSDNDKDKDYIASEDEVADSDVIMISDEEFAPKGRAVIPSPPHKNVFGVEKEVLVEAIPDFVPIINEIIATSTAENIDPQGLCGPPIPTSRILETKQTDLKPPIMEVKTESKVYEVFTIDSSD